MSKLSVYRTFSFWFCLGMAWVNLVLMFVATHVHSKGLFMLAVTTMACCVTGAILHWLGERTYGRRR